MKIEGIKKIISLGEDNLSEYDFCGSFNEPYIGKIVADVFIYSYNNYGYEGSGIAVWRYNNKWSYQYLGHCSCYGALEDIKTSDKAKFSLKQIKEILLSKDNENNKDCKIVATYLNKYKK